MHRGNASILFLLSGTLKPENGAEPSCTTPAQQTVGKHTVRFNACGMPPVASTVGLCGCWLGKCMNG